jgi:hypothetical protein
MKKYPRFTWALAALIPCAVGCNSILGIKEHSLAAGGKGGASGTGGGGVVACTTDGAAGDAEHVDPSDATACGFTMPNPLGMPGTANAPSYTLNPQDGSLTDNVTGLIWEGTVDPGDYSQDQASRYCVVKGGGWRLPTRIELISLLDFSVSNPNPNPPSDAAPGSPPDPSTLHPMINGMFRNTPAEKFWTSSHKANDTTVGWAVGFDFGNTRQKTATDTYRVRCVRRSSQCSPTGYEVQAANGTVLDLSTGLTWQRGIAPHNDWTTVSTYCSDTFGGEWRLPSLTELQTLVDETKESPSINVGAFPCSPADSTDFFWTATQYAGDPNWAYYTTFIHGHADIEPVTTSYWVRCVR